ncbi:MAG: SH3 domain-containing protein [Pseudolabrys sp.]
MVEMVGPPAAAVRNRPINATLRTLLERAAAAAGIDKLDIVSGGQPGTTGGSVGSHRHDGGNAADLKLIQGGVVLSFEDAGQRPTVAAFVTAAAANGATGIGAGVGYMGPQTLHIGFGTAAVWGAGGASVNAPQWLKEAVDMGRNNPDGAAPAPVPQPTPPPPAVAAPPGQDDYVVVATGGAELCQGPGDQFGVIQILAVGTEVTVLAFEGANKEWAMVDTDKDGVSDGHVLCTSLAARKAQENPTEEV